MVTFGVSADRRNERRWHVAVPVLIGAFGLALTASTGSSVLGMTGLIMVSLGGFAAISQFWSLPPAFLTGASAAAGIAFINALNNFAGFVAPAFIGMISARTGSIYVGLGAMAACMAMAAPLVILGIRDTKRSASEATALGAGAGTLSG
jgi:predicted MFS family arabinose efflux permease